MNEFVSIFYTLLPDLQWFGMKDLHIMLLSFVSHIKNGHREGSNCLTCVKECHSCAHSNYGILQLKQTLGQSVACQPPAVHSYSRL